MCSAQADVRFVPMADIGQKKDRLAAQWLGARRQARADSVSSDCATFGDPYGALGDPKNVETDLRQTRDAEVACGSL